MKKEWTSPELTCLSVEETNGPNPGTEWDEFTSTTTGKTVINLGQS